MAIAFITGGNKGLGYETAKRLIEMGHKVYIGSRNAERGKVAADELGAELVSIDVTSDESVKEAARTLMDMEDKLDILINNAGISGVFGKPENITGPDMEKVFDTNVFGIVRVTNAFIPLLRKSNNPVIVNVSSGLGSFGMVTDSTKDESKINSLTYSSAKAAVSMLTLQYAKGLPDIKVNCADPGATATDLNGGRGKQTVQEGTDAIVRLATIGQGGPSGTFMNRHGIIPW
ncbi:MAG: SDR family NAD(P)-dependent oxidoreductase [Oscillospiraceae bacterium]|nr:SDR family NAD(P)-dependent oxidoreductase [Oscillospiraceae bacterium]